MSSLKVMIRLIATIVLLSMGFVVYPPGSANAAKYCAELGEAGTATNCARRQPSGDTPTLRLHPLNREWSRSLALFVHVRATAVCWHVHVHASVVWCRNIFRCPLAANILLLWV